MPVVHDRQRHRHNKFIAMLAVAVFVAAPLGAQVSRATAPAAPTTTASGAQGSVDLQGIWD